MNYAGQRPGFLNQVSPARQPIYNPGYHQPMMPRPPFVQHPQAFPPHHPMMPVIQPHLNPNFITQNPRPPRFIPAGSAPASQLLEREDAMPLLPEKIGGAFEPTPPSRLSPRSALLDWNFRWNNLQSLIKILFLLRFVAENNKALQRQRQRSFSPGRSRSRSPYAYRYNSRSRSRSPHYKAQISHIVRKRTRSKSPSSYIHKSRSPRRRLSPVKRPSPKYAENDRNKRRPYKHNGNTNNRDRPARQENDYKDRRAARTPPKSFDKERFENGSGDDKKAEKSPPPAVKETKAVEPKEKREKTEQELEDELLASTDSESSVNGIEDDEFKMTLDDRDLDFLDDDEEESENEGRFKSKPSEQKKPAATTNSFKSSYPTRNNSDKSRNYGGDRNNQRSEYRRYKYSDKDDSKRDRKRSRSPIESSERRTKDEKQYGSPSRKRKSPEARKSPEPAPKPTKETAKPSKAIITITSKDKQEAVKDEPRKVKVASPMFKATFKTVEPQVDEKKKGKLIAIVFCANSDWRFCLDEEAKKDDRVPDRIRLVRASVVSKIGKFLKHGRFSNILNVFDLLNRASEGGKAS